MPGLIRQAPTTFSHAGAYLPPRLKAASPGVEAGLTSCFTGRGLLLLCDVRFLRLFDRALVLQPRDRHRPVSFVEVDQPHALRSPADERDAVCLGAQNHALLGDEHQLLVLENARHPDDLAIALAGLDVDDAD